MPALIPRYPVYVPSKGRSSAGQTARFLIADGVPFHLVVEPQEREQYAKAFGEERLLVLPFSNLGLGSIPARNWIWEHAKAAGHARHWIMDDNIQKIYRRFHGRRLPCASGAALRLTEDFIERYTNVGIGGMNYEMFIPSTLKAPPFFLNCHVYSTLLIRNDLPYRWRGRYNEDTDLCLQVLAGGLCTVAMNAFVIKKLWTMTVKGGNTEDLYQGDGRLKMARSLKRLWPYVVDVKRRFKRPQHVVRGAWKGFDTQLIRRDDIDWDALANAGNDEHGLRLHQVGDTIKSEVIRGLVERSASLPSSREADEELDAGGDHA